MRRGVRFWGSGQSSCCSGRSVDVTKRRVIWLVLAAQLSVPLPSNTATKDVRALFSARDFPAHMLSSEMSRTVYTRTTVRPDGSIVDCAVDISSGDKKLDEYTCSLILLRAKFMPAKWEDGSPVYGVLRVPVNWTITTHMPSHEERLKSSIPDLELLVNQLPKGARKIASVTLQVAADESGRVMACIEHPPLKNSGFRRFPELVPIACNQAKKTLRLRPPLDASGKPSRSIQTASVHFTLDRSESTNKRPK